MKKGELWRREERESGGMMNGWRRERERMGGGGDISITSI